MHYSTTCNKHSNFSVHYVLGYFAFLFILLTLWLEKFHLKHTLTSFAAWHSLSPLAETDRFVVVVVDAPSYHGSSPFSFKTAIDWRSHASFDPRKSARWLIATYLTRCVLDSVSDVAEKSQETPISDFLGRSPRSLAITDQWTNQ